MLSQRSKRCWTERRRWLLSSDVILVEVTAAGLIEQPNVGGNRLCGPKSAGGVTDSVDVGEPPT